MTSRTYGQFLSNLNHAGRLGKIIKTMPDFEPGTDPEIVKLNHAIGTAKKMGTCIISRLSKDSNYSVGIGEATLLSTFLNNEYVGVLTRSGNIHEYKNLGSREYVYAKEIDILSCFVDNIETYETDKKNFNDAVKAAHKYQIVIRENGKYKSEYKGTDDNMISKVLDSDYLGVFTKGGNYAEFKKIAIRKITEKTPPPMLYSGEVLDESLTTHTVIIPPPIPVIPPKKEVKKETIGDKVYNQFNNCVRRTSDFNFVKFKNGEFNDVFGYIHNINLVDSLLDGNYIGFRTSKNKLVEYYNLGPSDLFDGMVQNPRLLDMGFTDETTSFLKAINSAIESNGWFIYRWKNGPFSSNYYDNGSKPQTILRGVDYFAHINVTGKITEFVKLGERDIDENGMDLPVLNLNKKTTEEKINQLEKSFRDAIDKGFRMVRFKNDVFEADNDVMWNYRVQGSDYFAFRVGNALAEYCLLEVRNIEHGMLPNPKLQNYDIPHEYQFAFQNELRDARAKFLVRTKSTSYVGAYHMNVADFGKADYIGIIDNDRAKIYEYIKTGVREITPEIELPNLI